ncbi:hypothetical protein AB0F81_43035 [Actinoplanes sp. NPDC024001]|uniref:hypothetical protein n=1 Tax=Actinoplanes sp. NPDC024001 TaxID=3154598 RepID=UPI0034069CD2
MLSDAEQRRRAAKSRPPRWGGIGPLGWLAVAAVAACLAMLLESGVVAVVALSALCLSFGLWAAGDESGRQ